MRAVLKEEKEKKKKEEEDETETEEEGLRQATELLNEIGLAPSSEDSSPNIEKRGESKNKLKKSRNKSSNSENNNKKSNNNRTSNKYNRNNDNNESQNNNNNRNNNSGAKNCNNNSDRLHALNALVRSLIGNTEANNTQNSTISALMGGLATRINNNPALQPRQGQVASIQSLLQNHTQAQQTQNNLGAAQNNLGVSQSNLGVTQNNLGVTQNNLGVTQNNLGPPHNNLGGIVGNMIMQQQMQTPQPFQNYQQMNYALPGISYPFSAQSNDFVACDGYQMNSGQFYSSYPMHTNYFQSYNPHVPPPQLPVYPTTRAQRHPATIFGGHPPPPLIYEPPPYFRPGVDVSTNTTQSEVLPSAIDGTTTPDTSTRCNDSNRISCSEVQVTLAPGRSKLYCRRVGHFGYIVEYMYISN